MTGHRHPRLPVRIAGTSAPVPGRAVTTVEIAKLARPERDAERLEASTGIKTRYFADELPSTLCIRALTECLEQDNMSPKELDRIIYVSSGGGELAVPALANVIAAGLGLGGTCDCFDLQNGCMGFLTAFDIAARAIATGGGPVGIAVMEAITHVTTPDDPRPYCVFGDAVAAAVIAPSRGTGGILGSWLRNDGIQFGNVRLANPLYTREPEFLRFTAGSDTMLAEAFAAISAGTNAVLEQANLDLDEVEWILPHQPNGAMLEALTAGLGFRRERVVPVVHDVGSIGAASIPVSLHRLMSTRAVAPGHRVLMVGVGAGISYGAILLEIDG